MFVARPGGVAPGPPQDAWASMTSTKRPRASRRRAKSGPVVQERCDTPAPVARGGNSSLTLRSDWAPLPHLPWPSSPPKPPPQSGAPHPPGPGQPPEAPLPLASAAGSFGRLDVKYPASSPFRPAPAPGSPHPELRYGQEGVGSPQLPGSQAFLGPGCGCDGKWVFSHSSRVLFIQQLLSTGRHRGRAGRRAPGRTVPTAAGLAGPGHGKFPAPSPQTPFQPVLHQRRLLLFFGVTKQLLLVQHPRKGPELSHSPLGVIPFILPADR